jgi:hypothetical protein
MFCPQCGNEMEGYDQVEKAFDPTETIAESRDARTQIDAAQPPAFDPSVIQPLRPVPSPTEALRPAVEKAKTQAMSGTQLAGTSAVVQPAEKKAGRLKKVSSAVLDQAAYDPSLRFLLVAGGFFLVFLLLLLLSKVVG